VIGLQRDFRCSVIEDMRTLTLSDTTQRNYIRHIDASTNFLGRLLDTTNGDDDRRFNPPRWVAYDAAYE
jgi:hypothetical protein